MFANLTRILSRLTGAEEEADPAVSRTRLAAAALLVHVAAVDGDFNPAERQTLLAELRQRFDLESGAARALLRAGVEGDNSEADFDAFTTSLKRALDEDGRLAVVDMLWRVAEADGRLHEFEESLIWRIADLLGVRDAAAAARGAGAAP